MFDAVEAIAAGIQVMENESNSRVHIWHYLVTSLSITTPLMSLSLRDDRSCIPALVYSPSHSALLL